MKDYKSLLGALVLTVSCAACVDRCDDKTEPIINTIEGVVYQVQPAPVDEFPDRHTVRFEDGRIISFVNPIPTPVPAGSSVRFFYIEGGNREKEGPRVKWLSGVENLSRPQLVER